MKEYIYMEKSALLISLIVLISIILGMLIYIAFNKEKKRDNRVVRHLLHHRTYY